MNVPVDALTWIGAAAPVILLLILLIYMRWSAVNAAAAGLVVSVIVAIFLYKTPLTVAGIESAKGLWNSLSIMAVIFPAILIYEISRELGAFVAIQTHLTRLIPDKLLQILAIGWCFSSFLQGPSGFGVPVAVAAPLLVGIGVRPVWAVIIALMAHAWANLFGTLGLGWEALIQQVPLTGDEYWQTAWWSAALIGILNVLVGFLICWQYRGFSGLRHGWPAVVVIGGIHSLGQLILTQYTPALAVVIPATIALGGVFLLGRLPRYAKIDHGPISRIMLPEKNLHLTSSLTMNQALLPYYLLVLISVTALLIEPINRYLNLWKIGFSFPETITGYGFTNGAYELYSPIALLSHSGFFLLLSAILAASYYAAKGMITWQHISRVVTNSWHKFVPSAVSVTFLLIMSKVMSGSGQIYVLASGTATVAENWYAFLSPTVGMIGAFMASSSVNSNILFGQFQESMAILTHKSTVLILAGQAAGSAIGTMISPSKVLLAVTTAGVFGQEGIIFKILLVISLMVAAIMGIVVFALA